MAKFQQLASDAMSETAELSDAEIESLEPYLPKYSNDLQDRPHVTLTYASSLDSMISLAPGVRTTLSGPETKSMTHYLRLHHDAILIGVGTAVADDPGLNCRYPGVTLEGQPRSIIIDPHCRWKYTKDSKLYQLAKAGTAKAPWIVCLDHCGSGDDQQTMALDAVGGSMITLPPDRLNPHRISWSSVFRLLHAKGIRSVMVEGGSTIINNLLQEQEASSVDSVIVTIAPTWLGQGGVVVSPPRQNQQIRLRDTRWQQYGQDVVLCGRLSD